MRALKVVMLEAGGQRFEIVEAEGIDAVSRV